MLTLLLGLFPPPLLVRARCEKAYCDSQVLCIDLHALAFCYEFMILLIALLKSENSLPQIVEGMVLFWDDFGILLVLAPSGLR